MAAAPVPPLIPQDAAARRRGTLRTVWIVAAVALAIYAVFLLTGVLGQ